MVKPVEPLTWAQTKEAVISVLTTNVYNSMRVYLNNKNPSLWGIGEHGTLVETYLPLMLYHDISAQGFNQLEARLTKDKEKTEINYHSKDNNSKILRKFLQLDCPCFE